MEGNDSCLNHWKSEIMPEKKFGEWRERERFFSSGECRRMEEELENGKKKYILILKIGKRFL